MIQRYWRELLFVFVVGLPLLALLPLGFFWLHQQGWLVWWAGGAALACAAAFGLQRGAARAQKQGRSASQIAPASPEWGEREQLAWRLVESQAEAAEPLSADAWPLLRQRLEETVDLVAQHFHPDAEQARWRITVPESLLLIERVAHDLRTVSLAYVPGADHIQLAHLFQAHALYERHGETARKAFDIARTAKRLTSLTVNPTAALFHEIRDLLAGEVSGYVTRRLRCDLAQILVKETGRAAIDLYAGRLRLDRDALQALADEERASAPSDLVGSLHLLLTGQVGAGKSSLLNALAQRGERRVKRLPERDALARLQLQCADKPVTITDLPGLGYDLRGEKALDRHIDQADMLVWVVKATDPARASDMAALERLRTRFQARPERRFPPLLIAVTHIDQLAPQREWNPPYDLHAANQPKAQAICAMQEHVAQSFAVERDQVIPVMTRSLEQAYNIDLLWQAIAHRLNAARFTHLDRLHRKAGRFSFSRTLKQAQKASHFVAQRLIKTRNKPSSD